MSAVTKLAKVVNGPYTPGMGDKHEDPSMETVRARFEASGLTLHELGLKMGYPETIARQSAFQFMKSEDPRISSLRRFAAAMGVSVEELVAATKKGRWSR
jgi:transcriptional regulator with XRE-family HTH domain